jgi:DNA gyrase subunit A
MGRNTSGVKGIKLTRGDHLVGMVVADPEATLLTACANGYGKRTWFGPNSPEEAEAETEGAVDEAEVEETAGGETADADDATEEAAEEEGNSSSNRYRTQGRGGKGVRDIKTTARNGKVVDVTAVSETDEILMNTAGGKIQRIRAADISLIGRNTQGVRIIRLDEDDTLVSVERIPSEILVDEEE